MNEIPGDLKFTKTHEWLRIEDDQTITVGITHHAQDLLGDIVFIELPEIEVSYNAGDDCAVIESVKAASDIYCPIVGQVIAINEDLADTPELVNKSPYDDGWVFKLRAEDIHELEGLLSPSDYEEYAEEEEH